MPPVTFYFASRTGDSFYDIFTCRLLCERTTDEELAELFQSFTSENKSWIGEILMKSHLVSDIEYKNRRSPLTPVYIEPSPVSSNSTRYGIVGPCKPFNTELFFNLDINEEKDWLAVFDCEEQIRRLMGTSEDFIPRLHGRHPFDELHINRTKDFVLAAEVYSLQIDKGFPPDTLDIVNFGTALAHNKLCVIYFVGMHSPMSTRSYHDLMRQSLQSFSKVTLTRANEVIAAHPRLPFDYFSQYDIYIRQLITLSEMQYIPAFEIRSLGMRSKTDNHDKLRSIIWEWRRVASETRHHPERKRKRGEFQEPIDEA